MNTTPYIPRAGSLPDRVAAYFRRLPDEELSTKDIALKYQVDANSVQTGLKLAVESGLLARDGQIYSAGEHINQGGETPAVVQSSFSQPAKPRRIAGPRVELPDLADINIEDDIPLPGVRAKAKIDWNPLLDRMVVNQSFALPPSGRHTLSNAITIRKREGKGVFTIRKIADDQLRVWRTA